MPFGKAAKASVEMESAFAGALAHCPQITAGRADFAGFGGNHRDGRGGGASHALASRDPGVTADPKIGANPVGGLDDIRPTRFRADDAGLRAGDIMRIKRGD